MSDIENKMMKDSVSEIYSNNEEITVKSRNEYHIQKKNILKKINEDTDESISITKSSNLRFIIFSTICVLFIVFGVLVSFKYFDKKELSIYKNSFFIKNILYEKLINEKTALKLKLVQYIRNNEDPELISNLNKKIKNTELKINEIKNSYEQMDKDKDNYELSYNYETIKKTYDDKLNELYSRIVTKDSEILLLKSELDELHGIVDKNVKIDTTKSVSEKEEEIKKLKERLDYAQSRITRLEYVSGLRYADMSPPNFDINDFEMNKNAKTLLSYYKTQMVEVQEDATKKLQEANMIKKVSDEKVLKYRIQLENNNTMMNKLLDSGDNLREKILLDRIEQLEKQLLKIQ